MLPEEARGWNCCARRSPARRPLLHLCHGSDARSGTGSADATLLPVASPSCLASAAGEQLVTARERGNALRPVGTAIDAARRQWDASPVHPSFVGSVCVSICAVLRERCVEAWPRLFVALLTSWHRGAVPAPGSCLRQLGRALVRLAPKSGAVCSMPDPGARLAHSARRLAQETWSVGMGGIGCCCCWSAAVSSCSFATRLLERCWRDVRTWCPHNR